MICYVVIKSTADDVEILYCGDAEWMAEEKLYDGKKANVSMEVWENGNYIRTKWGNH